MSLANGGNLTALRAAVNVLDAGTGKLPRSWDGEPETGEFPAKRVSVEAEADTSRKRLLPVVPFGRSVTGRVES